MWETEEYRKTATFKWVRNARFDPSGNAFDGVGFDDHYMKNLNLGAFGSLEGAEIFGGAIIRPT